MSENFDKTKAFIVIGLGSMGTRRVKHCLEQKYEVIGYDVRYDRTQKARNELQIQVVENFLELENIIKTRDVSGVFIDVPPAEHFRYMQYCFDKNINFFVEQPAVHTQTLVKLCQNYANELRYRKQSMTIQVSCNLRKSKLVNKLRDMIQKHEVSTPVYAHVECAEYLPDWHPYEPYTDYYPSSKNMGGGLDVICDIDWLSYLFGMFRIVDKREYHKSKLMIDTYDVMHYTLEFAAGPLVTIYEDFLQRTPEHTVKLVTPNQVIFADFINNTIRINEGEGKDKLIEIEPVDCSKFSSNDKNWNWVEETYYLETLEFISRVSRKDTSLTSLNNELYKLTQLL